MKCGGMERYRRAWKKSTEKALSGAETALVCLRWKCVDK